MSPAVFHSLRPGPEWQQLSTEEYDRVIAELRPGDCGRLERELPEHRTVLTDSWGNRFQLAIRKVDDGTVQSRLWSTGPDDKAFTDDDLVIPEDEGIPPNLR